MEGPLKSPFIRVARIAVLAFAAAASAVSAARADDYGPHPDIRTIRRDVPALLEFWNPGAAIAVPDVVVAGNEAVATWSDARQSGVVAMKRRSDRWWMTRCGTTGTQALAPPEELAEALHLSSPQIASAAIAHVPALRGGFTALPPGSQAKCPASPAVTAGSAANFFYYEFEQTLANPTPSTIVRFNGRAATPAEMPPTPHMTGLFFFDVATDSMAPVALRGATLDVWFPFVLDPSDRYVLWLGFVEPEIAKLPGKLAHNVLHFDLPAFTLPPGKAALGEIDGSAVETLR